MKKRQKLLSDEQWELIEPLFPPPRRRRDNRGRPWASNRTCFDGILWILQTGAAWRFLPDEFPSPSTLLAAAEAVGRRGRLAGCVAHTAGCAGRGRFTQVGRDLPGRQLRSGKKGAQRSAKPSVARARSGWYSSPGEATLAEATLAEVRVPRPRGRPRQKPKRVIADRGYDSDPLRERFKRRGIELIVPYRKNNRARRYEDGRKLRRYKRRWIVERTNAWLGQFRRLLVRHEHLLSTYRAFFYIACFWITLRHCL